MRTAIIGQSPAFTLNLANAFGECGEAKAFHATPADYRQHDNGILLSNPDVKQAAKEYINQTDLVFVSGAISLTSLALVGGSDWVKWGQGLNLVVYVNDSPYFYNPEFYDGLIADLRATYFIMPDLLCLTRPQAIPVHFPQRLLIGDKSQGLIVLHTPGRERKMEIKGTTAIEEVINRLWREDVKFEYQRLVGATYQDSLKEKTRAHIVIDQLPAPGLPRGLGSSGLEGLSAGAAVLTDMYDPKYVKGFFAMPPVVAIHNQTDLYNELKRLIADRQWREELQQAGQQWVKDNLAFESWLAYVQRYL